MIKGHQKPQLKRYAKKAIRIGLAALISLSSMPALSAIPYRNAFESMDLVHADTKELNLSLLAKIQAVVDAHQFNMAHYVPLGSLPQYDDGSVISRRILKQTMKTIFESEDGVNSPLVQNAQAVQDSMGTSIDRHGHKFSFRVKAFDGSAEVAYKGYVTAALTYSSDESETRLEVSKVVDRKTYAFTYVENSTESKNEFGVRWSF